MKNWMFFTLCYRAMLC